jgi:hypothetical protein
MPLTSLWRRLPTTSSQNFRNSSKRNSAIMMTNCMRRYVCLTPTSWCVFCLLLWFLLWDIEGSAKHHSKIQINQMTQVATRAGSQVVRDSVARQKVGGVSCAQRVRERAGINTRKFTTCKVTHGKQSYIVAVTGGMSTCCVCVGGGIAAIDTSTHRNAT